MNMIVKERSRQYCFEKVCQPEAQRKPKLITVSTGSGARVVGYFQNL